MVTVVKCPICTAPVEWSEASPWRPFCSERCRTIDLGEWAANRRSIPGQPADSADDAPAGEPAPKPH
jgi:hypothetical protein